MTDPTDAAPESKSDADDRVEQADARLAAFETALVELRAIVAAFPTEEQAERAIRTERTLHRVLAVMSAGVILALGVGVMAAYGTFQARDAAASNRRGVQCLLFQVGEHRSVNHNFNKRVAGALRIGPPQETLIPHADLDALRDACTPFFPDQTYARPGLARRSDPAPPPGS